MSKTDLAIVGVLAAFGAAWWLASPAGAAAVTQARAWWGRQQPAAPDVEASPQLLDELAEAWAPEPPPVHPHDRTADL